MTAFPGRNFGAPLGGIHHTLNHRQLTPPPYQRTVTKTHAIRSCPCQHRHWELNGTLLRMLHGVHAFCGDAELYKEAEEKLKEAKIK